METRCEFAWVRSEQVRVCHRNAIPPCQNITKRSAFVGRAALLLNSRVRGATIVPEISCARETIFYDIRFTDDEESTNSRAIGRH